MTFRGVDTVFSKMILCAESGISSILMGASAESNKITLSELICNVNWIFPFSPEKSSFVKSSKRTFLSTVVPVLLSETTLSFLHDMRKMPMSSNEPVNFFKTVCFLYQGRMFGDKQVRKYKLKIPGRNRFSERCFIIFNRELMLVPV